MHNRSKPKRSNKKRVNNSHSTSECYLNYNNYCLTLRNTISHSQAVNSQHCHRNPTFQQVQGNTLLILNRHQPTYLPTNRGRTHTPKPNKPGPSGSHPVPNDTQLSPGSSSSEANTSHSNSTASSFTTVPETEDEITANVENKFPDHLVFNPLGPIYIIYVCALCLN